MFPDIDLLLVNDGTVNVKFDLPERTKLIELTPHLGRQSINVMPGWKRSFSKAMEYCSKYKYIAHIESDCYLFKKSREKFLKTLNSVGYYTGWDKTYGWPETALQIINSHIRTFYINMKSENIEFERMVQNHLKPVYFLKGERFEGINTRLKNNNDYLANLNDYKVINSLFLRDTIKV